MPRKPALTLVPPVNDSLRQKLDRLAIIIADRLISPQTINESADTPPLEDQISGLKALSAWWQSSRKGMAPDPDESAYSGYRKAIQNAPQD